MCPSKCRRKTKECCVIVFIVQGVAILAARIVILLDYPGGMASLHKRPGGTCYSLLEKIISHMNDINLTKYELS